MNAFIAPLFIETNPGSREKVACALLAVTPQHMHFRWSKAKIAVAEKLSDPAYKGYFTERFRMIEEGLRMEHEARQNAGGLFEKKSFLSADYFSYLGNYNAGPVRFGEVRSYAGELDRKTFDSLFDELITEEVETSNSRGTSLLKRLSPALDRPALKAKADINQPLPQRLIPAHLTEAKVMVATMNGSAFLAQPFDLNNQVDYLQSKVWEYQSIHWALRSPTDKAHLPLDPLALVIAKAPAPGEHAELLKTIRDYLSDVFIIMVIKEFEARIDKVEKDPRYKKLSTMV